MSDPAAPPDVSKLCINCGLCCSGMLYPHASLTLTETDEAEAAGFEVVAAPADLIQTPVFALPCQHLAGTACSIYGQWRPKVCAAYFCELAVRLRRAELSMGEAEAKVQTAHEMQAQVQPLLADGETWTAANERWRSKPPKWPSTPEAVRFHLLMTTLNLHLDRHFRRDHESTISEKIAE